MMQPSDDPLARALAALDRLGSQDMDPVTASAWQEAREGVLDGMKQRKAFWAITRKAANLIDVLDDYEVAFETGDKQRIEELAAASAEAEDALVDALNRVFGGEEDGDEELQR